MNIIALKVQNQGEELVSDYVMGFDYNISQDDVTIEKKFVEEGEVEYHALFQLHQTKQVFITDTFFQCLFGMRHLVVDLFQVF